jgi:exopolyphosphatase/pppGpp-phosphohydrolase
MNPTTYSTLEIHSDAVNLLIGAVVTDGDRVLFRPLERPSEVLELSVEIARDNRIGAASTSKLEGILKRYGKLAHRNSGTVFAAATGAAARVSNAVEIFERLSAVIGEPIHLLSDARESGLAAEAALERLDETGVQLIIDAGSAFTYVALTNGRVITASTLLPIGTTRLASVLVGDPPGALSWSLLASKVGFACQSLPSGTPVKAWATGSAAHNLVGLDRTEDRATDKQLCMPDLCTLADELMALPIKKLARRRGEDPRRIVLLPPGLVIVSSILEQYGLSEATVMPEGIREGIVRAGVRSPTSWWLDQQKPR